MSSLCFNENQVADLKTIIRETLTEVLTARDAQNDTLTAQEVMDVMGISYTSLWRLVRSGELKDRKAPHARKRVFLRKDVMRILQSNGK